MKIALAGNPNCGKTTLFNALTGSNQHVGNWPGVTVEKKEGKLKGNHEITVVDLPGIYSLSPYSLDERVARNYLMQKRPDLIVNLVDASNLERNLYLTSQLTEMGIPVVIALNMMDVVQANGAVIHIDVLSKQLGCPLVAISALKNEGIDQLIHQIQTTLTEKKTCVGSWKYESEIESALTQIQNLLKDQVAEETRFWYALKCLEQDESVLSSLSLDAKKVNEINHIRKELEKTYDDDVESIMSNARYEMISGWMKTTYKKGKQKMSRSDRIDRIVTNRWLALPIFALVMILVYYVSVTTVGAFVTDWTNDVLFGEIIPPVIEDFLNTIGCAEWMSSLILDGIVGGVGAVLGFVPQMLVLFLFLALLEDIGYMSRIAFILDRVFRKFGLSGKSFIPMLIGTGCGVPGIMASRTIENEYDRRMTIMTTTFIPCSAKLPIIALIAGALFQGAWWVSPLSYFIGVFAIIISGIILKKTSLFMGDPSPFIMELPPYHMPKAGNILRSVWERGFSFIRKAGTIILLSAIVIWFLSRFGIVDGAFVMLEEEALSQSFLAVVGSWIAPLFAPLGWGFWEGGVAAITGLVAKENVVTTFGILFGFADVAEDGAEIWGVLSASFTSAAAFSFLVFNLLCAPCFAAIGAIKREMNHTKWTLFAITYQCVFAYAISFMIYQFWICIETGTFGVFTILAVLVFLLFLYGLFRKPSSVSRKGKVIWQPSSC